MAKANGSAHIDQQEASKINTMLTCLRPPPEKARLKLTTGVQHILKENSVVLFFGQLLVRTSANLLSLSPANMPASLCRLVFRRSHLVRATFKRHVTFAT